MPLISAPFVGCTSLRRFRCFRLAATAALRPPGLLVRGVSAQKGRAVPYNPAITLPWCAPLGRTNECGPLGGVEICSSVEVDCLHIEGRISIFAQRDTKRKPRLPPEPRKGLRALWGSIHTFL